MASPITASQAWLVRVNLDAVAKNLTRQKQRLYTDRDANRWLTQPIPFAGLGNTKELPSPFRATSEWSVLYTEEDPALNLNPDEILTIRETKPTNAKMPDAGE